MATLRSVIQGMGNLSGVLFVRGSLKGFPFLIQSILKKKTLLRLSRGKVGPFDICTVGISDSKLSHTDSSGRLFLLLSLDSNCLAQKPEWLRQLCRIVFHCRPDHLDSCRTAMWQVSYFPPGVCNCCPTTCDVIATALERAYGKN